MSRIFHITTADEAAAARRLGTYAPRAFDAEGFIHCSYERQVCEVANRLFAGRPGLVLLEIDPGGLTCPIVDENLEGDAELFPHVYGPLPMSVVTAVHEFSCDPDGRFALPSTVSSS